MKLKSLLLPLIITAVLSTSVLYCMAQCCTTNHTPCPSMEVSQDEFDKRTKFFVDKSEVYKKLKAKTNDTHPKEAGTMVVNTFFDFIKSAPKNSTGLKIYFGAFDQNGSLIHNNLVPIYAFTKNGGNYGRKDDPTYYLYDAQGKKFVKISPGYAQTLHVHFTNELDMDKGEVHSLWFPTKSLTDWITEIECQQTDHPDITELKLTWAAYYQKIKDPITNVLLDDSPGRLTLLFTVKNAAVIVKKFDANYDTAVPCPPGQNCDAADDGLDNGN